METATGSSGSRNFVSTPQLGLPQAVSSAAASDALIVASSHSAGAVGALVGIFLLLYIPTIFLRLPGVGNQGAVAWC